MAVVPGAAPIANNGAFLALYNQAPVGERNDISLGIWQANKDDPVAQRTHNFGEQYINTLRQATYHALPVEVQDEIAFKTCTIAAANAMPGAPVPPAGAGLQDVPAGVKAAMRTFITGMLPP